MPDGRLSFDTSINTDGFSKGIDTLTGEFQKLRGTVGELSRIIAEAAHIGFTADTTDLDNAVTWVGSVEIPDIPVSVTAETNAAEAEIDAAAKTAPTAEIVAEAETETAERKLRQTGEIFGESFRAGAKKAKNAVSSVDSAIGGIKKKLSGLGRTLAAVFGVRQLIAFGKSAKDAFEVQLEAETKLSQVLRRTTGATSGQIQAVKDWSSELQELGVIGDEVQLAGLQELGTYIGDVGSLKTMNVVLNDMLAQQYGMNATGESAVTIATMLGKVLDGQTAALSRYGYSFTAAQENLLKYGTEEQKVATLAEVVEASVGGMNEALAKTPSGRLKQVSNALGDIKERFGEAATTLLTVLLPAIERAVQALSRLAEYAVRSANAIASLFGVEVNSSAAVGSSIAGAVQEQQALTEAVGETAKAQERALAGFDKMNILSSGESSDNGDDTAGESTKNRSISVIPEIDTAAAEEQLSSLAQRLKALAEPIRLAWDANSGELISKASFAAESVKGLISSVGQTWAEVWESGDGERAVGSILAILGNILGTVGNIAEGMKTAWDSGTGLRIVTAISGILLGALSVIQRCAAATEVWAEKLDFTPLLESVVALLEAVEPLSESIGDGIVWFYENALLPLAEWTIETAVPAFLLLLAAAARLANAALKKFKPYGKWLWEKFLSKIADFAGAVFIGFLEDMTDLLDDLTSLLNGDTSLGEFIGQLDSMQALALTLTGIFGGTKLIGGIKSVIAAIAGFKALEAPKWISLIASFFTKTLPETILPALSSIAPLLGTVAASVGAFFAGWELGTLLKKYVLDPFFDFQTAFNLGMDMIVGFFTNAVNSVKTAFSGIGVWFGERWNEIAAVFEVTTEFFSEVFSSARAAVEDKFKSVGSWFKKRWSGIKSAFAGVPAFFSEKFAAARDSIKEKFRNIGTWFGDRKADIKDKFSGIKDDIGGWFSSAWDKVSEKFLGIGEWFGDRKKDISDNIAGIKDSFREWFSGAWENVKGIFSGENVSRFFGGVLSNIRGVFSTVKEWFREKFEGAYSAVTESFSGISEFFSGKWQSIKSGAVDSLNGIISKVEEAVNIPMQELMKLAAPVLRVFGIDSDSLKYIHIPRIPALAQGTVVPANYGEFLAVLGDNKREAEIVSPLSTIKRAVREAMAESGGNPGKIEVICVLDGREIGRAAVKAVNDDKRRSGT